jgi:putative thioredoxin
MTKNTLINRIMIDFQKVVIEKSFELPVVVDFWAPWCGPCRILGPVIEQIASEQEYNWTLVKINTEENQDLASKYGIKSIPNVKMFYRGEVVDEFSGALPRQMILDWLKQSLPNPGLLALDKILAENEVPELADLELLMDQFPDSPEIRIVLSQLVLWDDPAKAVKVLETIKMGTPFYDKATYLRDISAFLEWDTEDDQLQHIKILLKEGNLEEALTTIIHHIGKDNKAAEGKLAKAAIGIFNTLGTQHPLTKTYRKQLDMFL